MKYLLFIPTIFFLCLACNSNQGLEPSSSNEHDSQWLAEIVKKANTDPHPNYYGTIWLEKYNGQDVYATNMLLTGGLRPYHIFDKNGRSMEVKTEDFYTFLKNMKLDKVVYSNLDSKVELQDISDDITAFGVGQPHKNIPWLKMLVLQMQTDRTLNYMGTIWVVHTNGQDMIVVDMAMSSVVYYFFDENGNSIEPKDIFYLGYNFEHNCDYYYENLTARVIYSNITF